MACLCLHRCVPLSRSANHKVLIWCGVARAMDNGDLFALRGSAQEKAPGSGDFPQSPGLQWVDSRRAESFRYGADTDAGGSGVGRGIGGGDGGGGGLGAHWVPRAGAGGAGS